MLSSTKSSHSSEMDLVNMRDQIDKILDSKSDPNAPQRSALLYRQALGLKDVYTRKEIRACFGRMRVQDLLDANQSLRRLTRCEEKHARGQQSCAPLEISQLVGKKLWRRLENLLGTQAVSFLGENHCKRLVTLNQSGFKDVLATIKSDCKKRKAVPALKKITCGGEHQPSHSNKSTQPAANDSVADTEQPTQDECAIRTADQRRGHAKRPRENILEDDREVLNECEVTKSRRRRKRRKKRKKAVDEALNCNLKDLPITIPLSDENLEANTSGHASESNKPLKRRKTRKRHSQHNQRSNSSQQIFEEIHEPQGTDLREEASRLDATQDDCTEPGFPSSAIVSDFGFAHREPCRDIPQQKLRSESKEIVLGSKSQRNVSARPNENVTSSNELKIGGPPVDLTQFRDQVPVSDSSNRHVNSDSSQEQSHDTDNLGFALLPTEQSHVRRVSQSRSIPETVESENETSMNDEQEDFNTELKEATSELPEQTNNNERSIVESEMETSTEKLDLSCRGRSSPLSSANHSDTSDEEPSRALWKKRKLAFDHDGESRDLETKTNRRRECKKTRQTSSAKDEISLYSSENMVASCSDSETINAVSSRSSTNSHHQSSIQCIEDEPTAFARSLSAKLSKAQSVTDSLQDERTGCPHDHSVVENASTVDTEATSNQRSKNGLSPIKETSTDLEHSHTKEETVQARMTEEHILEHGQSRNASCSPSGSESAGSGKSKAAPSTEPTPLSSPPKQSTKRKSTGTKSSFFKTVGVPASPNIVRTKEVPLDWQPPPSPSKTSVKLKLQPSQSCIPMPPLKNKSFGLVQEIVWKQPLHLLIATMLLNQTTGRAAIPKLFELIAKFPTPESLAKSFPEDVTNVIGSLGLQWVRAGRLILLANLWLENPPSRDKRYRVLHYPKHGNGADIQPNEILGPEEEDPRSGAWEVAHLVGVGPYALDSWRIFCRDKLRGLADDWNGMNANPTKLGKIQRKNGFEADVEEGELEVPFEPEWKRVLPLDKELRAFLRWMWLKEGWEWDPATGKKTKASQELLDRVNRGAEVVEVTGKAGLVGTVCAAPQEMNISVKSPSNQKPTKTATPGGKRVKQQHHKEFSIDVAPEDISQTNVEVRSSMLKGCDLDLPLPPNRGDKAVKRDRWRVERQLRPCEGDAIKLGGKDDGNHFSDVHMDLDKHDKSNKDGASSVMKPTLADQTVVVVEDSQPRTHEGQQTHRMQSPPKTPSPKTPSPEAYKTAPSSRHSYRPATPRFNPINAKSIKSALPSMSQAPAQDSVEDIESSMSDPRSTRLARQSTPARLPSQSKRAQSVPAGQSQFSARRKFLDSDPRPKTARSDPLATRTSPSPAANSRKIKEYMNQAHELAMHAASLASISSDDRAALVTDDEIDAAPLINRARSNKRRRPSMISKRHNDIDRTTTRSRATSCHPIESSRHGRGRVTSQPPGNMNHCERGRGVSPSSRQSIVAQPRRSKSVAPSSLRRGSIKRNVPPQTQTEGKLRPTRNMLERQRRDKENEESISRIRAGLRKDETDSSADVALLQRVGREIDGLSSC